MRGKSKTPAHQPTLWLDALKATGAKAVHPAVAGPDHILQKSNFIYWRRDLAVGDTIAIGDAEHTAYLVRVKRIFSDDASETIKLEYEHIPNF